MDRRTIILWMEAKVSWTSIASIRWALILLGQGSEAAISTQKLELPLMLFKEQD